MYGFHESRSGALEKTSADPPTVVVSNCEYERRDVPTADACDEASAAPHKVYPSDTL